jgi:enoyl-CoA hydratase
VPDTEVVRYQLQDRVAVLTLDSPANRNALSTALVEALQTGLARAAADAEVRAVLLTHTGGTFCAGADLREALEVGMEQTSVRLVALLRSLVAHPQPVVALIDGDVRAGGLGLVGGCDIVVAGPASTFAFTEARLGLAPAIISLVTTPRMTNRAVGRYYLTGETFDAAEAARIGLVTVAAEDPGPAADQVLDAMRLCSPQGLAESKRLTAAPVLAGLDAGGTELAVLSARLFGSQQAREGMSAFRERRPPRWAATASSGAASSGAASSGAASSGAASSGAEAGREL